MTSAGVIIERGDPWSAGATALLKASHALMESLFPSESNHYLPIEALCVPEVRFFVALIDADIRGCVALADKAAYGEVKSMFVDPAARGQSVGAALIAAVETEARALDMSELKLETGYLLYDAHRLYERAGFTYCGSFGEYPDDPNSRFMTKSLKDNG